MGIDEESTRAAWTMNIYSGEKKTKEDQIFRDPSKAKEALGGPLKSASGDISRGKETNNMESPENEYQEIRDRKTYFKKEETSKARQWLTIMVVISGDGSCVATYVLARFSMSPFHSPLLHLTVPLSSCVSLSPLPSSCVWARLDLQPGRSDAQGGRDLAQSPHEAGAPSRQGWACWTPAAACDQATYENRGGDC